MPSTVWIQFVKLPLLGKVKTRLAATIGDEAALVAHKRLTIAVNTQLSRYISEQGNDHIQHLWLGVGGVGGHTSDAAYQSGLDVYKQQGLIFQEAFLQDGQTLGDRMRVALGKGLEVADRAFIVGSDFPVLDLDYLASAEEALSHADVVLGATEDGGYGLIGLKRPNTAGDNLPLSLSGFRDVLWGTDEVCQQTQDIMRSAGLKTHLLATRFDVDDEVDWRRWQASAWNN
ncbi:hypothetical protein A3758_06800 [Oleiphilus sp. HI0118]|jgi:rSAM/selenodomain-associated transferase 1|nr:hypothetical protein A3758_06800 [Oleiphilus sp. HI0118]